MRKIRVILMGGLGNQLFQYAFAMRISRRFNAKVLLDPNFAAIRLNESGMPDLASYDLNESILISNFQTYPRPLKRLVGLGIRLNLQKKGNFENYLIKPVTYFIQLMMLIYFGERSRVYFSSDNGYVDLNENSKFTTYFGYFQSFKFSRETREISELRTLKPRSSSYKLNELFEKSKEEKPLVVHVRLSDYRNEPLFGIPSKNYYKNAISHQMGSGIFNKIWLFSDEPSEAISYIPPEYQTLVVNISAEISGTVESLEAMRFGKGFVIANSSFSWWGAYLANQTNAPTIYPSPWFSGMPTPHQLCPPSWTAFDR